MTKLLMLACCLLSLTSCSTGYHASGLLMSGYDEFRLAPDQYRVQFSGNEYTSENRAYQYALRRSAELTKAQGFQYFKITNSSVSKTKHTYTTPVTKHTASSTDTYHYEHGKIKENEIITTVSGGDVHENYSPSISFNIKMYQHDVEGALNSDIILSNFEKRR
ncbi:MAG: hypothetical protein P1U39_02985 [Legionellaceae bacterium]|nr:hypothetical protein [Legionellaceae bacterium]